jgi:hypothetical protein
MKKRLVEVSLNTSWDSSLSTSGCRDWQRLIQLELYTQVKLDLESSYSVPFFVDLYLGFSVCLLIIPKHPYYLSGMIYWTACPSNPTHPSLL